MPAATLGDPELERARFQSGKGHEDYRKQVPQFRAEFSNIPNHTNFNYSTLNAFNGNPNPAYGGLPGSPAPTAGLITSIVGSSRQIQFGLKVLF